MACMLWSHFAASPAARAARAAKRARSAITAPWPRSPSAFARAAAALRWASVEEPGGQQRPALRHRGLVEEHAGLRPASRCLDGSGPGPWESDRRPRCGSQAQLGAGLLDLLPLEAEPLLGPEEVGLGLSDIPEGQACPAAVVPRSRLPQPVLSPLQEMNCPVQRGQCLAGAADEHQDVAETCENPTRRCSVYERGRPP